TSRQAANVIAVLALEQRFERQPKGKLDRFAGGPRRSNDNDPSGGRLGCEKSLGIGGKEMVARGGHCGNIESKDLKRRSPSPPRGEGEQAVRLTNRDDAGARNDD